MQQATRQLSSAVLFAFFLLVLPTTSRAEEAVSAAGGPTPSPTSQQIQPAIEPAAPIILQQKTGTSPMRLGYVDVTKVAEESKAGKAGLAQFRDKADKYEAKAKAKEKQLDKLKAALEAQLPALSPDQRAAKIKEFDKKVDEFRRFAQNVEKEMRALQEELNKGIFTSLEKAARTYGETNGFAVIIAKKELFYLSPVVAAQDLTDAILKQMNEQQ
jgi:outer membrane protein